MLANKALMYSEDLTHWPAERIRDTALLTDDYLFAFISNLACQAHDPMDSRFTASYWPAESVLAIAPPGPSPYVGKPHGRPSGQLTSMPDSTSRRTL